MNKIVSKSVKSMFTWGRVSGVSNTLVCIKEIRTKMMRV